MNALASIALKTGACIFPLMLSANVFAVVVNLDVDESQDPPTLYVSNNNAQCRGGPVDCIEVTRGSQPHMFFKLNKACQPGGSNWRLSRFYVMKHEKHWPAPLTTEIANEFCADPNTGEVNMNRCDNKAKNNQIKIKNYNRKEGTVYYMVEAEHCTDTGRRPIGLDPEIRNKGGNN